MDRGPLAFDEETLQAFISHERATRSEIVEWRSADDDGWMQSARRWTYQKVATRTGTGAVAQTLKQMTRRLPKRIAHKIT